MNETMFRSRHTERVHQLFADQFEPSGDGFLYRRNLKEAAVRVSATERDMFEAQFRTRIRWIMWSIVPATLLLIAGLVLWGPDVHTSSSEMATYAGSAAILIPFLLAYRWAWNSPARALDRRAQLGEPRTREEMKRLTFARLTYGQLGSGVAIAAVLMLNVADKHDVLHGWGRLWLVFFAALLILLGAQAFRKWRFDRELGGDRH